MHLSHRTDNCLIPSCLKRFGGPQVLSTNHHRIRKTYVLSISLCKTVLLTRHFSIIEEFRGLAWAEVKPEYLDYENAQILLIGESVEKAVKPTAKDQKHDKAEPKEELEQLAHEDELRVEHLSGK